MITGTVNPLETLVPAEVWPSDVFADLAGALRGDPGIVAKYATYGVPGS